MVQCHISTALLRRRCRQGREGEKGYGTRESLAAVSWSVVLTAVFEVVSSPASALSPLPGASTWS